MGTITVIKGNIVTTSKVRYGGCVIVVDETIVAVCDNAATARKEVEKFQREQPHPDSVMWEEAAFVLPGFVDIHNHGLGGTSDVIGHWSNPEYSLKELARCGTLTTLASIIFSDTHKKLVNECIAGIEKRVGKYAADNCILGGIHAEGPVINDRGGLPECKTELNLDSFKALVATMPSLRVMTISPHIEARCNYEKIRYLLHRRVRVALGHDRVATKAEIMGALKLAVKEEDKLHVTHLCNVSTFHHRKSSLVNAAMCKRYPNAALYSGARPPTLEIIGDLIHVDSVTLQSVFASRDVQDVAVITDCISAHLPGKHVVYNGRDSVVQAAGGCYLCDSLGRPSGTLAGGTSMLADLFYALVTLFEMDIVDACQHTATVPARIAYLHDVGSIDTGKKANLLLFNTDLNRIEKRMIHGHWTTHKPYNILRPSVAHM
ncbi:N-acetylglucosamine-6-phosphate deacetylase-like protein [Leptomonas pyrrhocoris]|uniref:N-acetylglucosamine-6-phosphate deacetylase-like protein n=1 Tax=Leptomonas pyrrhocoris TaxID=157538 RepID=A0A0M9G0P6_LEPPY|nr:N-acetylglucosamine-6-phosphate deacetylase-like protein [Leptomonas pyrrhocoris]KPA79809.1 N-acetylglucosamine-6-phosphate deacetylase-like protein [Leptomonas pyrrhocoris]|eukprot:XP_015658248.1 N-acetylglucosamine-6-phosphate deacetylase-like protein [Leptomonas pyrrhocoris]